MDEPRTRNVETAETEPTHLDDTHEYQGSDEHLSSADEYDDAILLIQPDETSGHKALRRLVDKIFVGREHFRLTSVAYEGMQADEDGVSVQLRSMLFPPSRQVKRRGKRRNRTETTEREGDPSFGNKQVQRQSKQKERCENKLMSLLFATVYDHATKRCRLAGEVPPLKLVKTDKKGQRRNVSNYTEVRAYLRHKMSTILAGHVSAVKILLQMLPSVFDALPFMFMLLSRTFMVLYDLEYRNLEDERDVRERRDREVHRRLNAEKSLESCASLVQEYLEEWGRRSYTTDNPLKHFGTAGMHDECYKAIFQLLRSMIAIVPPPPSFPYCRESRGTYLYSLSLLGRGRCDSEKRCALQSLCPTTSTKILPDPLACHEFVQNLCHVASICNRMDLAKVDSDLHEREFPTAVWRTCISNIDLHRLNDVSLQLKSIPGENDIRVQDTTDDFVKRVTYEVAQCWAALSRSNSKHIAIVENLGLEEKRSVQETIIELVFGGGIAATAIFEREDEIRPIAEKLHGRKIKSFLSRLNSKRARQDVEETRHSDRGINEKIGDRSRNDSSEEEGDVCDASPIYVTLPVEDQMQKKNHVTPCGMEKKSGDDEEACRFETLIPSEIRDEEQRAGEAGRSNGAKQKVQNGEIKSQSPGKKTGIKKAPNGPQRAAMGHDASEVEWNRLQTSIPSETNTQKEAEIGETDILNGESSRRDHPPQKPSSRAEKGTFGTSVNARAQTKQTNDEDSGTGDVEQRQRQHTDDEDDSPVIKRRPKTRNQVKRRRRGTITQTLQEAKAPPTTRTRLRKKPKRY